MNAESLHDEEVLGNAYDARLMLRLWPFVRPYAWIFALDLLLFVPLFVLELAPAWIIMHALDSIFGGLAASHPDPAVTAITQMTSQISQWSG